MIQFAIILYFNNTIVYLGGNSPIKKKDIIKTLSKRGYRIMEESDKCIMMTNGGELIAFTPPVDGTTFLSIIYDMGDEKLKEPFQKISANLECVAP